MPLEVPSTIAADTARQVGEPKFRLPASEKTCPFSFFNFVHRTTSHGGDWDSVSPGSSSIWLLSETFRLWVGKNAGDDGLGDDRCGEAIRDWNLWSNGRKDGVGLARPVLEAWEGSKLLLGEDITEP